MSDTAGEDDPQIEQLLKDAESYPLNLRAPGRQNYVLDNYAQNLAEREGRLFCHESAAEVSLLSSSNYSDLSTTKICTAEELVNKLRPQVMGNEPTPVIQYVFIYAPSSREKLKITGKMFRTIMAFHQVNHEFLDFCFSFGFHAGRPGFYFGGYRSFKITDTRRSGSVRSPSDRLEDGFQMMYNLKAIEPSGLESFPYSIRVAAVYHSINYENWKSTWIIVKGNQVLKDIFGTQLSGHSGPQAPESYGSNAGQSVMNWLKAVLALTEWCVEGWSRYVGHLEQMCETISLYAQTASVHDDAATVSMEATLPDRDSDNEAQPKRVAGSRTSVLKKLKHLFSQTPAQVQTHRSTKDIELQSAPYSSNLKLPSTISMFRDLEQVQDIGEKANEASLVLRSNIETLEKIAAFYRSMRDRLSRGEALDYERRFEDRAYEILIRIGELRNDLHAPLARVAEVATFVASRKTLLHNRLEFQNIISQQAAGAKAQVSADRMEKMTKRMNEAAERTEREAVAMRVLTFVTVFLLPGAFVSALMSTDIIHFNKTENGIIERVYSSEALKLYLSMSLPLTLFFMAFVYLYTPVTHT